MQVNCATEGSTDHEDTCQSQDKVFVRHKCARRLKAPYRNRMDVGA
jgi:hypothetical protein